MGSSLVQPASVYVPGKVRTVQSPLYATYHVALGAPIVPGGLLKLFGDIQGVGGIGPQQTNMQKAFELSGGESFTVRALRVVPMGCGNADWVSFCQGFTVRLVAGSGNVVYADAPAEYWAGGAGISGPAADVNNGVPDPRAIVPFDVDPLLLEDGVNFRVEFVGTSPGNAIADFFLRVYLDGQRTTGAQ
jgi:hypothetical protein